MRCAGAAAFAAALLLGAADVSAHRIDEYLQATLLSVAADHVQASMRLIPGQAMAAALIADIDLDRDGLFSAAEQRDHAQRVLADLSITVDARAARPRLVSWTFPEPAQMREGLGEVHIEYLIDLPPGPGTRAVTVANRHAGDRSVYLVNVLAPGDPAIRIVDQRRNPNQSFYELTFRREPGGAQDVGHPPAQEQAGRPALGLPSWFRLGMRHIAEGADHLLFLLVLLLPAPLQAAAAGWGPPVGVRQGLRRVIGTVTAFSVGHSLTLALTALGVPTPPARLVEVLIAASILVSAAHAWRPLFPGKEALVAASFGLVHGLAFAATLGHLGLGVWPRVAGTLAFNLGIEVMQLLLVAAVLPSLFLLSRTTASTHWRIAVAALAGTAAVAWALERLFGVDTHIDRIVDGVAQHAPWGAALLWVVSGVCYACAGRPTQQPRVAAGWTSGVRCAVRPPGVRPSD